MTDTFTWRPTSQSASTVTGAVKRARFGDGYTQRSADGLNHVSRSYQLTFVAPKEAMEPLIAFLETHLGQSFYWDAPRGFGLYACDSWSEADLGGAVLSVTATFEQTFQP